MLRSQPERRRPPDGSDRALHDALTDLCGYVLLLEAEQARLHRAARESQPGGVGPQQPSQRQAALAEEVQALRATIEALRERGPGASPAAPRSPATPCRAGRPARLPGSGSRPGA